ncbi:MAG: DUF3833 family protein [Gemmatimonadetes bacterium]|nr:DUF3833 family protein [Gemmatimonadota bacterium]
MTTPLDARDFFSGTWSGEGELVPRLWLRAVVKRQRIRFRSRTHWLSDNDWLVLERFAFEGGPVLRRCMHVRKVGERRLHVSADDIPAGADIQLHEQGFRFSRYVILAPRWGHRWPLRCRDENVVRDDGTIEDRIEMDFHRVPVARLRLVVRRHGAARR